MAPGPTRQFRAKKNHLDSLFPQIIFRSGHTICGMFFSPSIFPSSRRRRGAEEEEEASTVSKGEGRERKERVMISEKIWDNDISTPVPEIESRILKNNAVWLFETSGGVKTKNLAI